MKILLMIKLVALGSLFAGCRDNTRVPKKIFPENTRIAINSKNDTFLWKTTLKKDIDTLLRNKEYRSIEDTLFGDCINYFVRPNKLNRKIIKEDVLENFDVLFDKEFSGSISNILTEDSKVSWYRQDKSGAISVKNKVGNLYAVISIPIKNSETESTKLYWFHQIEGKWFFCGLTCTG